MKVQEEAELCFPELLNTSCRRPMTSWSETVLWSVLVSFISLLTLVLNLLVIISVSHFRQLHTPTNILLLSLAVSDFVVGLLLMPGEALRQTACWSLGDLACILCNYVSFILTSASVGDMVLISVDRYVAICHPLHYTSRVTLKRVKICVCLCWFFSILYCSILVTGGLTHPDNDNSCYGECVLIIDNIAGVVDIVVTFILPLTIIITLYMRVFMVAVSQARAMRSHTAAVKLQASVSLTTKKAELKAARTLGIVLAVFVMCFCPYYSVSLAGDELLNASFAAYVIYLFYLNSCLNPVIYALFYPWFIKSIKIILTLQILQPGSCEANIL
ncbi:trace amine-associated receptor 13c-like [Aulostomus maculatus]